MTVCCVNAVSAGGRGGKRRLRRRLCQCYSRAIDLGPSRHQRSQHSRILPRIPGPSLIEPFTRIKNIYSVRQ